MKHKPIWDYETGAPLPSRNKSLGLTWEDVKAIVNIANDCAEYAEVGIIEPFLASEQKYYEEVLRRFNEAKK